MKIIICYLVCIVRLLSAAVINVIIFTGVLYILNLLVERFWLSCTVVVCILAAELKYTIVIANLLVCISGVHVIVPDQPAILFIVIY